MLLTPLRTACKPVQSCSATEGTTITTTTMIAIMVIMMAVGIQVDMVVVGIGVGTMGADIQVADTMGAAVEVEEAMAEVEAEGVVERSRANIDQRFYSQKHLSGLYNVISLLVHTHMILK